MTFRSYIRRFAVPLVAIVAIVAVIVPTCQMVGCAGAMRFLMPITDGLAITGPTDCGGMFVYSSAPLAVSPSGVTPLLLTLMAALAVLVPVLFTPRAEFAFASFVRMEPPPPDDPRGERIRI